MFFSSYFLCYRWKTLQVFMGWLRLELCKIRWADTTLSQTHRRQTLQMPTLREGVFQEWPSFTSYEETLRVICELLVEETWTMLVYSPATRRFEVLISVEATSLFLFIWEDPELYIDCRGHLLFLHKFCGLSSRRVVHRAFSCAVVEHSRIEMCDCSHTTSKNCSPCLIFCSICDLSSKKL